MPSQKHKVCEGERGGVESIEKSWWMRSHLPVEKRTDLSSLLGGACLDVAVMRCMSQGGLGTQDQV